jgi:adenine-specific DNA-methyltransferase
MHYEYIFYIKKEKMSNKQPEVYFYVPYADALQVREDEEKYTYANGIVSRRKFLKSPLNYIGGKYKLLPQLIEFFPEKINTFVDLFSGGFNVGINVDCNKVVCNDMNTFIIDLYKELYSKPIDETLNKITGRINEYGLSKENEEAFKKFRNYYNKTKEPIDLYTLSCYSFNYQFRFNNNKEYNNPFGRNRSQFSDNMKSNLILFTEKLKSMNVEFLSEPFDKVDLSRLNSEDFVYCDPPYLITTGSYNDGNRGFKDWKEEEEIQLYKVLDELNKRKVKFALSNVIEHKGKENILLKEWSKKYKTIYLTSDYSNSSYNTKRDKSIEVLIINY